MGSLPKPIKKLIKMEAALVILVLVAVNPMGNSFAASVNSQEFFTYHIRDLLECLVEKPQSQDDFYLATGTYESKLGGELFGAAKGMNLIVVQLESVQNLVMGRWYYGQEITPCLNALARAPGSFYFSNFYSQIGSGNTSDAEFTVNNSMMGSIESYTYQLYYKNYYKGLPWVLRENGYRAYVLHGYKKAFWNRQNMYPSMGFERFFSADDFESDNIEGIGGGNIVGISDHAFYEQAADYLAGFRQPFYSFVISLSSHNPFRLPDSLRRIIIRPAEDNIVGDYINSVNYADRCLGEFMENLKERGLWDNSLVVVYGDHFGLSKSDSRVDAAMSSWLGEPYRYDMMMNVPLVIHVPGLDAGSTFGNSGGQIDLMPTIAYLLGIERLDTVYLGQNLFTGEDSVVAVQTHMLKGSYIKGDQVFEISRDGMFENSKAWSRLTGDETVLDGCLENSKEAKLAIDLSMFYLNNDVLRLALLENMSMNEIHEAVEGKKTELPDRMDGVRIESSNKKALGDFYRMMIEDEEKCALLLSDDIYALLLELETEYSGKSKKKGGGSLDEIANEAFLDVRARIVPVVSESDNYTKVESLGYRRIMVSPEPELVLAGNLIEVLNAGSPCGIAMSKKNWLLSMNIWVGSKVPVYIYDANVLSGAETMQVYRLRTW
ncbi:MAG: LTA synthase family protein [Clostridiales bacterium]|nr:LTA synthase family protein [Clostridiales bacterium]